MFTGLVADVGVIGSRERSSEGARLEVETRLATELTEGDSIAVDGVCLTAAAVSAAGFGADVMSETLGRSTLGALEAGDRVNLELPLRPAGRLGGHFVQGHVDGNGTVERIEPDGFARLVSISASPEVCDYLVEKGSVAVDGVSLTVIEAGERGFTVSLIPETLERTTLGELDRGRRVNVEVDILAKYVQRLAVPQAAGRTA